VGASASIDQTSIGHSRPRVSMRPHRKTDTTPAMPDTANSAPTTGAPSSKRSRTSSGTTIVTMPPAMLRRLIEKPRPRSVALRHT
jgi:hypothetical protein